MYKDKIRRWIAFTEEVRRKEAPGLFFIAERYQQLCAFLEYFDPPCIHQR